MSHTQSVHLFVHGFHVNRRRWFLHVGCSAPQDDILELFRETAIRHPQFAVKEIHHTLREIQCIAPGIYIFFCYLVLDHKQRQIAHYFRRRRHFDNIPQHSVHLGVGFADFRPLVSQAYGFRLLPQVGILPTGHFVLVYRGIGAGHLSVHPGIIAAYHLPIPVDSFQGINIQLGLPLRILQCIVQTGEGRLTGSARQSTGCHIYNIHSRLNRTDVTVQGAAAAFVAVKMNGQIHCIFQGRHQGISCFRFQKARHILDSDNIGAGFLHFLCQVGVIGQRIFLPAGIQNIPSVANGCFCHFAQLPHFVNG